MFFLLTYIAGVMAVSWLVSAATLYDAILGDRETRDPERTLPPRSKPGFGDVIAVDFAHRSHRKASH